MWMTEQEEFSWCRAQMVTPQDLSAWTDWSAVAWHLETLVVRLRGRIDSITLALANDGR